MPYRYTLKDAGFYHIYNRGNNKQEIFHKDADYAFFIFCIDRYRKKYAVYIAFYCLMPNHFHMCLSAAAPNNIVQCMKQIQMLYAKYHQQTYRRVGHLFQGRYQAKHVKTEETFLYLSAYIHTNPIVAGLVSDLRLWLWSSYLDYISYREGYIPQKDEIFSLISSPAAYKEWIDRVSEEKMKRKLGHIMID